MALIKWKINNKKDILGVNRHQSSRSYSENFAIENNKVLMHDLLLDIHIHQGGGGTEFIGVNIEKV